MTPATSLGYSLQALFTARRARGQTQGLIFTGTPRCPGRDRLCTSHSCTAPQRSSSLLTAPCTDPHARHPHRPLSQDLFSASFRNLCVRHHLLAQETLSVPCTDPLVPVTPFVGPSRCFSLPTAQTPCAPQVPSAHRIFSLPRAQIPCAPQPTAPVPHCTLCPCDHTSQDLLDTVCLQCAQHVPW